jgi:hypothetical protein
MQYCRIHNGGCAAMMFPLLIPPVVLGAGIGAYNFLEGENLLRDMLYEYRLTRTGVAQADHAWARNPDRCDSIVSLTTIPSRIAAIENSLKSLMLQTRAPREIHLNLPHISKREGAPYAVPSWLAALKSVKLVACEDLGPATKLLPTLRDCDSAQLIVAVDDDRIYPPNLLADLEAAAGRSPGTALGFSGWVVPPDLTDRPTTLYTNLFQQPPSPIRSVRIVSPVAVDILQGMSGYAVRPCFFDLERLMDYTGAPPAARFVDDVWISGHCKVPKFVIPARRSNFPPKRHFGLHKASSLGWINRGPGKPEARNNTIMLKYFDGAWTVGGRAAAAPRAEKS